jgi:hypothetical protein
LSEENVTDHSRFRDTTLFPNSRQCDGLSWQIWEDTKKITEVTLQNMFTLNFSLPFYFSCRYREAGVSDWSTIPVTPPGSTQVTINRLSSGTTYEFQVVGKNALGDGMLSKVITVRTLGE